MYCQKPDNYFQAPNYLLKMVFISSKKMVPKLLKSKKLIDNL